jgi:dTDP-4-amino-4,6-dideoxygalactose transaminase
VPCEPDPGTYNIDPARIAGAITPRTRAILPIHLYGQTADMTAINALGQEHGLFILEDAAQSHGASCRIGNAVVQAGALGHAAGVSFYPSKNLGALADAGAVTTNDDALAEKIRHLRNYGSKVRYHHEYPGLNSRMSELQAAFLRAKLPRLPEWNARRAALARRYLERLQEVGDIVLPAVPEWAEPGWHLFVIRTTRREALQAHLAAHDIGTQVHYPVPPHLSNAYRGFGWRTGDYPLAERLAHEVLSLPMGPHLSAAQVDYVCDAIAAFFAAPGSA